MTLLFQTYRPLRPFKIIKIYPIQSNPLFRGGVAWVRGYVKRCHSVRCPPTKYPPGHYSPVNIVPPPGHNSPVNIVPPPGHNSPVNNVPLGQNSPMNNVSPQ